MRSGDPDTVPPSARSSARWAFVASLLFALLFSFGGGLGRPLTAPDEIRVAEIGREMSVTGDLVVPRLAGEPFLEKPPLYFAAVAGSLLAFGVTDGAARMPTAVATVLTLLLAFLVGRRLGGPLAGVVSTVVLSTTPLFFHYSQFCLVDSWLTLFVALGTWAFVHGFAVRGSEAGDGRPPAWSILVFWLAVSLGCLTKGIVTGVVLVGPLFAALLFRDKRAALHWFVARPLVQSVGVTCAVAAVVLWPLALYEQGGAELLDGSLLQNALYRALPGEAYIGGHQQPPWFYLGKLGGFLPWLLVLPFAWSRLRPRPDRDHGGPGPRLEYLAILAGVLPIGLILLSIPGTKRSLYLVPLAFAPAVVAGVWLAGRLPRARLLRLTVLLAVVALVGNRVWTGMSDPGRDMSALAYDLADLDILNESLVGYRLDERTRAVIPFRTELIVRNVTDPDELVQATAARVDAHVLTPAAMPAELACEDITARFTPVRSWTFRRSTYTLYSVASAHRDEPR